MSTFKLSRIPQPRRGSPLDPRTLLRYRNWFLRNRIEPQLLPNGNPGYYFCSQEGHWVPLSADLPQFDQRALAHILSGHAGMGNVC